MTPQERQLVDDLFDRLAKVENASRDPEAAASIVQGMRKAPNAIYALVQTTLLQDEALKRAHDRIQELEGTADQNQSGGFLDSMRETIFGQGQQRGSVPSVRPPETSRATWNSGQALQQAQNQGRYDQAPFGQQQPYGGQQPPPIGGGGGGSFLGTAAAAAAGMVGGSLLLGSIRSMMGGGGGNQQSFGDSAGHGGGIEDRRPWSDQSGGDLARQAGINDIGSSGGRGGDSQRSGLFDSASNDDNSRAGLFDNASNHDDHDDMDLDSDDFGGDGDSDSI